jgi:zinc protease
MMLTLLQAMTNPGLAAATGAPIERAFLDNGLEVLMAPKPGIPLVTIEIAIRAGSFIEDQELAGLTHLHEHMFFKANKAIPHQEAYLKRLDELGMNWNGSTSTEVVRYYFTLPSALLEEGLVFLRDAIQSPLFLEEELEKERKVVIGEYDRYEANPLTHLRRAVNQALFWKHFSRKNPIGDRAVILSAARERLQFIQDEYYVPNNAALVLSGEFDAAGALEKVERLFGAWERRPDPFAKHPVPPHPPVLENRHLVVHQPVQLASVIVAWHGPSVTEKPRDTLVADLLSRVLGQPGGRFQKALVDSGLATSASLAYQTQKYVGPIYCGLETAPAKVLQALAALRAEIDALGDGGAITQEDLDRARRQLIHDELFEREKAREFALALGYWWSIGGTDYYLSYFEGLADITLEDLQAFARTYLRGKHVAGVMASPEAVSTHSLDPAAIAAAFAPRSDALASAGMQKLALAGGVPLLARVLASGEIAAFQLYFADVAARVTEDKAGIENLLLKTLTDRIERDAIDELNRLGIRVHFNAQADYSMLGVECLRPSLARAIGIVGDVLLRLPLAAEDVERNRAQMLAAYARVMENPQSKVSYLANETFYPKGHPYRAYPGGTDESLKRIRLEDLESHRRLLLGGRKLCVAVAALSAGEIRALAEQSLAGIGAGGDPKSTLQDLAGAAENPLTVEDKSIPTCYVLGKFAVPSPEHPDHDTLRLALRILSQKLWLEVRSKRALTYAVSSGLIARTRSMGFLSVSTTQPNEALRVIFETIDGLVGQPLPQSEIDAAARSFATNEYLAQESPREQAAAVAQEEILAGDGGRALRLVDRLSGVRPEDVQRVLRAHLRHLHFGIIGPAPQLDRGLFSSR